jgi:molybdopterin synthase sulfur carrier subunit
MRIQLKLFASLREAVNVSSEVIELPEEIQTTDQLRTWLASRGEAWALAFAPTKVLRIAINQNMIEDSVSLSDGQEIAFFPPVTGG